MLPSNKDMNSRTGFIQTDVEFELAIPGSYTEAIIASDPTQTPSQSSINFAMQRGVEKVDTSILDVLRIVRAVGLGGPMTGMLPGYQHTFRLLSTLLSSISITCSRSMMVWKRQASYQMKLKHFSIDRPPVT